MEGKRRSFPEERRLKKRSDYDLVMQNAYGAADRSMVVYARRTGGEGSSALGLIVGRKASPKATVRNRIKRRLREAFRLSTELPGDIQIVVVAKNALPARIPFAELAGRLERLARKSLSRGPR